MILNKETNKDLGDFHLLPHKDAPILSNRKDGKLHLIQLMQEFSSGHGNVTQETINLTREASLVSLWFYLKVIAAFDGPYDQITKHLHLPMCNWRQSEACMRPGARAAGFMPRSHFKSTLWTHGSAGWEIIRDRNIRIRLTSSRIDKAEGFKAILMNTFKNNELFKIIFPEFVIKQSQADFTVPCRTKKYPEPTVKVGSTGGAAAGDHHDLLLNDDLIDEKDINAEHLSTVEMANKKSWFKLSKEALVVDWVQSRILNFGTRYALDDLYDDFWKDSYEIQGYPTDDIDLKPDGQWSIYYRKAVEDGVSIFPERFPLEKYDKMANSEDPDVKWTYQTQYMNDPVDSGLTEFNNLIPRKVKLNRETEYPYIERKALNVDKVEVIKKIFLRDLYIVSTVDPAFTDKGVSAKTSKSAFTIWAMDKDEYVYLLYEKAGYYDPHEFINIVFNGLSAFKGYCTRLILEKNGQQKMLEKPYNDGKRNRGFPITIEMIPSTGDKDARIRTAVGTPLIKGKLCVVDSIGFAFMDELKSFPMAAYKKDVLDASAKALENMRKPDTMEDMEIMEDLDEMKRFENQTDSYTGY